MENTLFKPRIMKKSIICSKTPNKSIMACQLQDRRMVIKAINRSDSTEEKNSKETVNRLIQGNSMKGDRQGDKAGDKH